MKVWKLLAFAAIYGVAAWALRHHFRDDTSLGAAADILPVNVVLFGLAGVWQWVKGLRLSPDHATDITPELR